MIDDLSRSMSPTRVGLLRDCGRNPAQPWQSCHKPEDPVMSRPDASWPKPSGTRTSCLKAKIATFMRSRLREKTYRDVHALVQSSHGHHRPRCPIAIHGTRRIACDSITTEPHGDSSRPSTRRISASLRNGTVRANAGRQRAASCRRTDRPSCN